MIDPIQQLARDGRRDEAIARLLPEYRQRVHALCLGILGQQAWAEDIAQEVFVKIWRALPAFDGRSQLSTWIYAIARNAALSALRTKRRSVSFDEPGVLGEVERQRDPQPASVGGMPDADDAALDGARLEAWIAQLPERQQQVVRLFYLRECSHEEVSEMLGMPVGTVKTLLHRGRDQLRRLAGVPA